jgi:hypothetical protein
MRKAQESLLPVNGLFGSMRSAISVEAAGLAPDVKEGHWLHSSGNQTAPNQPQLKSSLLDLLNHCVMFMFLLSTQCSRVCLTHSIIGFLKQYSHNNLRKNT